MLLGLIEELLDDAKEYARHKGKQSLSQTDIRLAVDSRERKTLIPKHPFARLGLKASKGNYRFIKLPNIEGTEKLRIPKVGATLKDNIRFREENTAQIGNAIIDKAIPENVTENSSAPGKYNVKRAKKKIKLVPPIRL